MTWECKIRKVDNGFIVTTYDEQEDDDGKIVINEIENVFEHRVLTENENVEIIEVLEFVAEHFGVSYSKHNKFNLDINWVERKGE